MEVVPNENLFLTETAPAAPGAPTSSVALGTVVVINWADNATNEVGYLVEAHHQRAGPFTTVAHGGGQLDPLRRHHDDAQHQLLLPRDGCRLRGPYLRDVGGDQQRGERGTARPIGGPRPAAASAPSRSPLPTIR